MRAGDGGEDGARGRGRGRGPRAGWDVVASFVRSIDREEEEECRVPER